MRVSDLPSAVPRNQIGRPVVATGTAYADLGPRGGDISPCLEGYGWKEI